MCTTLILRASQNVMKMNGLHKCDRVMLACPSQSCCVFRSLNQPLLHVKLIVITAHIITITLILTQNVGMNVLET
jgi:hypothetical protein